MVCAGTPDALLDTRIDPLYTPIPRFAGLIMICRLLGVFPLFGATDSQLNPAGFVDAVAENGSAVLLLVTEMV